MKYALEIKKLNAYATNIFGRKTNQILKNVSFHVPLGKICTFIGHNGAGKTTTVKSILGLRIIENGQIMIFDKPAYDVTSRQNVGYIPEKGNIERITALEFLRTIGKFYDLTTNQVDIAVKNMLKHFDLDEEFLNRKLNKLSSGQNKIITIMQAFLGDNKLIIADEPTDNLDPENRDMF
jgi:ABC-2 type transport system ATP-binding protein